MRFSDEKLAEFHGEFKRHVEKFEERAKTDDARFEALLKAQELNTQAITQLVQETRDIVQLHRDLQGAARLGKGFQNFGLWLLKWGAIGAGLAAAWNWCGNQVMGFFK